MDLFFMAKALDLARRAMGEGEVPVGAVVVVNDMVVASGYNRVEQSQDPTAHAEVIAVREASKRLGRWRLTDATLYVTLEPCLMCMGVMIQSRVRRLVYGATDPKRGAAGSLYDIHRDPRLNHRIEVVSGLMKDESRSLLRFFFQSLRRDGREVEGVPLETGSPVESRTGGSNPSLSAN